MAASTPINIDTLDMELKNHPDKTFCGYLISGLRDGFDTYIDPLPQGSHECPNLLSARRNSKFVLQALASEVDKGYMIGPFAAVQFPTYRISPLGSSGRAQVFREEETHLRSFITSQQ